MTREGTAKHGSRRKHQFSQSYVNALLTNSISEYQVGFRAKIQFDLV